MSGGKKTNETEKCGKRKRERSSGKIECKQNQIEGIQEKEK